MSNSKKVEIDDEGRIRLPKSILESFGVSPKEKILVELVNDEIHLKKISDRLKFITDFCGVIEGESEEDLNLKDIWKMSV